LFGQQLVSFNKAFLKIVLDSLVHDEEYLGLINELHCSPYNVFTTQHFLYSVLLLHIQLLLLLCQFRNVPTLCTDS